MIFGKKPIVLVAMAAAAVGIGSSAAANPITYNFTAIAAQPLTSGDVSGLTRLYDGVTMGQIVSGSLTYDPSAPILFTESLQGFKVATFVTGYWSLNLPTGQVGGPSAFLGSQVITENQQNLLPDFYDIPIQIGFDPRLMANLTFQYPSASTNLSLPAALNLASADDAFIHIYQTDVKQTPIGQFGGTFTLDFEITSLSAAVPELSTWAMMILGFAGTGFMAHRRKGRQQQMGLSPTAEMVRFLEQGAARSGCRWKMQNSPARSR